MTEEDWLCRARLLGIGAPEELTFGELRALLETAGEGEREIAQLLAMIAYRQAVLIAQAVWGGRLPPVYEAFPFWREEEVSAARLAHYRGVMERHAAATRKERKGNDREDQPDRRPDPGAGAHPAHRPGEQPEGA